MQQVSNYFELLGCLAKIIHEGNGRKKLILPIKFTQITNGIFSQHSNRLNGSTFLLKDCLLE